MLVTKLVVALVIALVALGVSIHLYYARKRSRMEWRQYDEAHDDDPPLRGSAAADRAGEP